MKSSIVSFRDYLPKKDAFTTELIFGLSQADKSIPCKYFYDERGSELFDQICNLPEYYLTRTEEFLLQEKAAEIAELLGPEVLIIEYGCGSIQKVRVIIDSLRNPVGYIAVDISPEHLRIAAEKLAQDYPSMEVHAICADFSNSFKLPRGLTRQRCVGFFLGSTIGNFGYKHAAKLLSQIAAHVGPGGGLVIGVDLKKDESVLFDAYNDASGITAEFNLNLLSHINSQFGATFDLNDFEHEARYNCVEGRIEMYLVSRRAHSVRVGENLFYFAENEKIHTENSYKYDITEFQALAAEAGFLIRGMWSDSNDLYSIQYFQRPSF